MKSEKDYINGLIAGSYQDFTCLYRQYAPYLYAFALKLCRSEIQAKEVLQETFIRIWVYRTRTDPGLSFKSYLFAIAKNLLLNEFRRKINSPVFTDYIDYCNREEWSENRVEQKIDFDEFNRCLQEAKIKLTPRQREIFELNKEYGLSVREIAQRTAMTEQSVRNQLSAALRELRGNIKDYSLLFALFFLL
ncbi:MAG: sigma-70 family RNA polymerase sigma factor [Parabacteroides sp.]|nr:sigma-70 family RNA polymerase sigma factor [Parabacteroides sp.]